MSKKFIAGAASIALALSALAAPAGAQPASVEVEVGDLDLATKSGNDRLQRRLNQAARQICGDFRIMPLRERQQIEECRQDVFANASDQVALAQARAQHKVRLARNDR